MTDTKNIRNILAFIDAPDPDNFALLIAAHKLFPDAAVHVVLTGRPVKFKADETTQHWDYDLAASLSAQQASAMRIKNFLRHFGIRVTRVFDGGIAPRTLVPHRLHFKDYYKFFDVDPLEAIHHSELDGQEELVREVLKMDSCAVIVGGPMTGLAQMITRHPETATKITELHAMFATWGNVSLMQFGDKPRGALQFNVACDPAGAYQVMMGLDCPIYLMPTEVTRVTEIGFANAAELRDALPQNAGAKQMHLLYALWYDAAVKPRQDKNPDEKIFIHDLVAALSLRADLREQLYEVVPIHVPNVPHLAREREDWGKLPMRELSPLERSYAPDHNRFAATKLKPGGAQAYLRILREIFD